MPIRYVNTAADPGGNGTTPNASSGDGTHAYNSQDACIAGEAGALTEQLEVRMLTGFEDARPDWDGFSGVTQTNNILLTTYQDADGHMGVPGNGYVIQNDQGNTVDIYEPWTVIEDFHIRNGVSANNWSALLFRTGADNCTCRRMILEGYNASGGNGTRFDTVSQVTNILIESTLFFNFGNAYGGYYDDRTSVSVRVRNCTVASNQLGMRVSFAGQPKYAYNTVGYNNTVGDWEGTLSNWTASHCASSDGTAPGTNIVSTTISSSDFRNATANDYYLADGSVLINGGTATELPALDIAKNPWVTNDVGCYARVSAGPSVPGTVTDGLTYADSQSGIGRYSRSLTDAMTQGDGEAGIGRYVRDTADNVELSDLVDALQELLGTIADEAQYNDSIVALATLIGSIQDGMTLQDTVSAVTEAIATLQDNAQYTDTLSAIATRLGALTDSQAFTDQVSGELAGSAFRSLADSMALSDAVSAVATRLGLATDTVTLSDVLIAVVSASRELADAFTYGDSIDASTGTTGFVLELYQFTDAADALSRLVGALSESYRWLDSVSVQAFRQGTMSDTVLWSDKVSYPALGGYLTAVVTLRAALTANIDIRG